jgi:diamine N-acetyltransferase
MSKTPYIRIATPSDVSKLCEIGTKTFVDTYGADNTPENLKEYIETRFNEKQISDELNTPNTVFLLVELDQDVIGYARMRVNLEENPDEKSLEIERIYIDKAYHGQKCGALLMQACIDNAIQRGYTSIWLGVWEHNPKAIAFYQKWGFEVFGTHIFQLGDDAQTDYLMKKKLSVHGRG